MTGRRDVLFLHADDIAALGLADGALVDVSAADDPARRLPRLSVRAHAIARGCAAAYYPEANGLVALERHDPRSYTPAFKSIPVHVRPSPRIEPGAESA